MPSVLSPTFLEICSALQIKRGYSFEVLCNDYFTALYPSLRPWISTKVEWTKSGTPDAYVLDEEGKLIAFQYGPREEEKWREKLLKDAKRVREFAAREGLTVRKLSFATTAEIDLTQRISAEREVEDQNSFPAEIYDLQKLAHDLENLYPGIAFRCLSIPIRLQRFMTLDAYLDSPGQRYWPKRKDVEERKLYTPLGYIEEMEIEKKLLKERRYLLTGVSGSGKTVLAIAISLWWRERHPEAVVFYSEASPGYTEQRGEEWYQQVLAQDYQNELFLIDNCHLAPAAVNAFCYQWERRRPEKALVLLISAPRVAKSAWETEPEDYFDGFESTKTVLEAHPEQIYSGMLRAYSDAYRRVDPKRFIPVELDLADPNRATRLKSLCAHNLIEAHSLLEAWEKVGGWLSDITEEAILDDIAERYLIQPRALALAPLCCLAQFEIPAHDTFVRRLPSEGVIALHRENLIAPEDSPYGRCYRIGLHPQTAARIFRAHIHQQVGVGYKNRIDGEILSHLETYLVTRPGNFEEVYYRLYRAGAKALEQHLLSDAELQTCAVEQFTTRPINEIVWYLYDLYRIDRDRAKNLLEAFVSQITESTLQKQVLELSWFQFFTLSSCLPKMNLDLARRVLGNLSVKWAADHLTFANPRSVEQWIGRGSSYLAVRLGYPEGWRHEVAKALNLASLADRAQYLKLQSLYWLLLELKSAAPELPDLLLTHITSRGLAKMFREQESTVQDLQGFYKVSKKGFMESFLHELGDEEIIAMFNRSKLGEIGNLLEWRFSFFKQVYATFAAKGFLRDKLGTEQIKEIGKFIIRLQRIPREGQQLAMEALEVVLETDLTIRVAEADAEQLALLLLNAHSVGPVYPERILASLAQGRAVRECLEHSGIRGIQLLLHNVAEMASRFLPSISEPLRTMDLTDRIGIAQIKDLTHFLWNVHIYVGADLAQTYCRIVDAQLRPEQTASADLIELGGFLWNLVHISDMEDLQTLEKPALRERLRREWGNYPGPCIGIFGIFAVVRVNYIEDLNLPPLNFEQVPEMLTAWLTKLLSDKRPYTFALAVKGLQVLNERHGLEIVRSTLCQESTLLECLKLLQEALEQAVTPRSRQVLEEAIRFVQQLRVK